MKGGVVLPVAVVEIHTTLIMQRQENIQSCALIKETSLFYSRMWCFKMLPGINDFSLTVTCNFKTFSSRFLMKIFLLLH